MTLTDFANIALSELDIPDITNIDDSDKVARIAKRFLPVALKEIQSKTIWGELIKTVSLAKKGATNSGKNQFLLPNGILKIIELRPNSYYVREGHLLLASLDAAILKGTFYSENPGEWSPALLRASLEQFKAQCVFALTNSTQLAANIKQFARIEIEKQICANIVNTEPVRRINNHSSWAEY